VAPLGEPLGPTARRTVDTLLADGPQAQEVWGVVLEVLGGMVAQAVAAGWPQDQAQRMVSAQFIANLESGR
jgi:hypothetical protein